MQGFLAEQILPERIQSRMMARAGTMSYRKGRPPFLGRQITQRSRAFERLFLYTAPGSELKVSQCPMRFRRILRTVFQGIQVAKSHVAEQAASLFTKAQREGHSAILKFISLGLKAVECSSVGGKLVLELQRLGPGGGVITLCDETAAFVSR
jgi:hypothetical protein